MGRRHTVRVPPPSSSKKEQQLTARLDSVGTGNLAELLVHVMTARAGIITEPNAKVLHLEGLSLEDLVKADDLSGSTLDLFRLAEEVPEAALGDDFVGSEDAHLVELGAGLLGAWQLTADNLVFLHHPY